MSVRIVVTGIGLCTPFGPDRESSWREIVAGKSAVRWLAPPHWTTSNPMAGAPYCPSPDQKRRHPEPLVELGLQTANEALSDARFDLSSLKHVNVGVVYGTSKGGLHTFSRLFQELHDAQLRSESTCDSWLDVFPSRAASAIRELVGGYGPNLCPVAACATGLAACLRGAELIRAGGCDVVLAGSADVSLQPALLGSFRRLGVLSREVSNPAQACRPFNRDRSGFAVGEGAACLVMERIETARARGATIYAEWINGRMLSDPFGLTQLDPAGPSLQKLLHELQSVSPRPDYINLHGTGTTSNDLIECQALRKVFGRGADRIACSSLKGGIGHLLGAAGSVELAATLLAMRDQVAPPTINLHEPDPACDLDLTPHQSRKCAIQHAWKLSLGFGGHLAGCCLKTID